ncbi:MAG TPA: GNAT family N-acetyltransferase [Ginsengibacter sp.]
MQTNITTERLSLNLLTLDDHDFIMRLVNSNGWIEFIGDRNVHTKEDAIAYINKIRSTKNLYYWVVRIKNENTPIGIISFLKRSYLDNFDIGFAFLPQFNGNGYAYEASKEILSMVSRNSDYTVILATTVPQNVNSIKLLTKLGLRFEKEIKVEKETLHIYSNSITN